MPIDVHFWRPVAALIADRLGLHFPDDRLADLRRGLDAAATEFGLEDAHACARDLLASRLDAASFDTVASHLTIGETYFFRGDETFAALAGRVLPALVEARQRGERRLRIWSAACCTGEEAYSLAILLRQVVPDIDEWHISILATDINTRFLQRAAEGVYGQWSFRGTPVAFRGRWFKRRSDRRYEIAPEIRRMVTFAPLNLVDEAIPSLATNANAMDLVLCRNVLMYFTPEQATRAVARLRKSLRADGWLVVAPCEVSQTLFSSFTPVNVDGAILYRPTAGGLPRSVSACPEPGPTLPVAPPTVAKNNDALSNRPARSARVRVVDQRAAPSGSVRSASDRPGLETVAASAARHAHALANKGELVEALACCDRWLVMDKMNPEAHYLRGMVLTERGDLAEARQALQRSLYLAPDVAMTCFAAGNLERARGRHAAAAHHYRHTLELLDLEPSHATLPHSEGVTAGQLAALVRDLLLAEAG